MEKSAGIENVRVLREGKAGGQEKASHWEWSIK